MNLESIKHQIFKMIVLMDVRVPKLNVDVWYYSKCNIFYFRLWRQTTSDFKCLSRTLELCKLELLSDNILLLFTCNIRKFASFKRLF